MHHDRHRTPRRDPVAGQAGPLLMPAGGGVRAGPGTEKAAPSGAGPRGTAGQRASSAPLRFTHLLCRSTFGVSPLEGVAEDRPWLRRRGRLSPSFSARRLQTGAGREVQRVLPGPQKWCCAAMAIHRWKWRLCPMAGCQCPAVGKGCGWGCV